VKLNNILLVGGIALLAYTVGGRKASPSLSPSSEPVPPTSPDIVATPGVTQVVNPHGNTITTMTQGQVVSHIQASNGVNTPIALNWQGNPLLTAYQANYAITGKLPSGIRAGEMNLSQTFVTARQPTTSAEHEAATHTNAIRALSESTGISQSEAFDRLNR